MILKRIFDILASAIGLILFWWVYPIVAILIKIYMPGPVLFCQKRVGMDGVLFTCHKFRTMTVNHNGSSVSVAGESRITPLGGFLRKYKLDELPELWDVLIGNMSFVGPRPDVPGYADCLVGEDRVVLKLRPRHNWSGYTKIPKRRRDVGFSQSLPRWKMCYRQAR